MVAMRNELCAHNALTQLQIYFACARELKRLGPGRKAVGQKSKKANAAKTI